MLREGEGVVDPSCQRAFQSLQIDWKGERVDAEEKIVRIVEEDSPRQSVTFVYVNIDRICSPIRAHWFGIAESIGPAVPSCSEVFSPQSLIHQRYILLKAKLYKYRLVQAQSVFDDASGDILGWTTDLLEPIEPSGGGNLLLPAAKGGVEGDDRDGGRQDDAREAFWGNCQHLLFQITGYRWDAKEVEKEYNQTDLNEGLSNKKHVHIFIGWRA